MYPDYLINLKEAVHAWTRITVMLDRKVTLDSPRLLEYPFLYVTADTDFELTTFEVDNVRAFFDNGGFMVIDNAKPTLGVSPWESSLRNIVISSIGNESTIRGIDYDHELFTVFFDFTDGPPTGLYRHVRPVPQYYLEGVWYRGRLAALISNKGYTAKFNQPNQNDPQLKFGINMLVYALIKARDPNAPGN